LSMKAEFRMENVELRTESPPPEAEAEVAAHAAMVELSRERVPTRRATPPPSARDEPTAEQRVMFVAVSAQWGG